MNKIVLRAGASAYGRIKKEGFTPEMVSGVVAAAGGPKWFTTYGLVRYVIGDLLAGTTQPIGFLGSSVGSWQMAAALTKDPVASIDRLKTLYCETTYSDKPDEREVSEACKKMIEYAIDGQFEAIMNHPNRSLQVVTARGKGLLSNPNKIVRGAGFAFSFLTNVAGRHHLSKTAERVIFKTKGELLYDIEDDILPTTSVELNKDNLVAALRASGTIPFLMAPISDISGAPKGYYWDGGMTDYHVSLPYHHDGIIIHPHFLPYVLPGWFDKKLPKRRRANEDMMSNVLLVTPSESYVNSLPRKQISDMKDLEFFGLDQEARISYWDEIAERSLELGEELKDLITSGELANRVLPYDKN